MSALEQFESRIETVPYAICPRQFVGGFVGVRGVMRAGCRLQAVAGMAYAHMLHDKRNSM
jgi:hypothetical protein